MKVSFTLVMILALNVSVLAQMPLQGARSKHFEPLNSSSLSVVLTGNSVLDRSLQDAFDNHWDICPVEYIADSQLEDEILNDGKYFFVPFAVTTSVEGRTLDYERYNETWVLTRGGYKSMERVDTRKWIYKVLVNQFYGEDLESIAVRLSPLVNMMNKAIKIIKEQEVRISGTKDGVKFMEKAFQDTQKLEKYTLLVNENNVKPDDFKITGLTLEEGQALQRASATKAEIEEAYPYKFDIVSTEKITEATNDRQEGNAVISAVVFLNRIIYIYDTSNYDCLYYSFDKSGLSIKAKHYRDIVKE